jgi:hypothetical protein
MKFDYLKQRSSIDPARPLISRPIVPIRVKHKAVDIDVYALVDSGADASLFHADIAKDLLIDFEAGRRHELFGVSGHSIVAYFHEVSLQVIGSKESIKVEIAFTDSTPFPALLGQIDFFEHHQIKFERYKERIEINPAKKN